MVPAGPPNYNMVQITGTPKQLRYTYPNNGVVPFNSLPSQINGLLKQALPFSGAVDLSVSGCHFCILSSNKVLWIQSTDPSENRGD